MSDNARYFSDDGRYTVELNDFVVQQLIVHITSAGRRETGGIIIGKYSASGDCASIKMITGPPTDSKSGYTWFERGVNGLQQLVTQVWKKKQYYLGEWHFHPNTSPLPSGTDIRQMAKIALSKQYSCPEPILLIIGGTPDNFELGISIIISKNRVIELRKTKCDLTL